MIHMNNSHGFKYLLFDIGGVFVQLTGVSTMIEWTGNQYTVSKLWDLWIHSTSVRLFETGHIEAKQFASMITEEFQLTVDSTEFIEQFSSWSNMLYPGSRRLLSILKEKYTIASLSNTNPIHWGTLCDEIKLDTFFHFNFPSHLTGHIKPAPETFSFVADALDAAPEELLFFDDNAANIKNASLCGLQAFLVEGVDDLQMTLRKLGLI